MIPQAEQLLERAAAGERLTTKERRHCVAFNMVKVPDATNVAMAELFQVSERQIRLDKQHIRQERAKLIKEDDIGLVIADIMVSFENQVSNLQKGQAKAKVGSRDYLEYCKTIFNFRLQMVKALQELGYYPKNLGNMTVDKYVYKATVSADGSVTTGPSHLMPPEEPTGVTGVEFMEPKALPLPTDAKIL